MGDAAETLEAGRRGGEHDRSAPAGFDHARDGGPAGRPGALQVGLKHLVPLVLRQLPGPSEADDPGVGADNVDPAELGRGPCHQVLHRPEVPDVGHRRKTAASGPSDGLGGPVQLLGRRLRVGNRGKLGRHVAGDDVGSRVGERNGVAAALTPARARDQGHPAGQ